MIKFIIKPELVVNEWLLSELDIDLIYGLLGSRVAIRHCRKSDWRPHLLSL